MSSSPIRSRCMHAYGAEAVTWRCSVKVAFAEILQNSHENKCVGVSFLHMQPADSNFYNKEWIAIYQFPIFTLRAPFFWVGKNFQNKIFKKHNLCYNFLFEIINVIMSMISLHTWNSKNWEKWSFVFFPFFFLLRFKTKITFPALLLIPKKLETVLSSKILPQMKTLWSN